MTVIQGWDLSLNHAGFVELVDGELNDYWYVTENAEAGKKEHGTRLPPSLLKIKDPCERNLRRLVWWKDYLENALKTHTPDYIGIEDYALDSRQGHMKGELGGVARILCWSRGIPLRLHEPMSVKMYVAHDGTCQKDEIEHMVKKRWNADFGSSNPAVKPNAKRPNRSVSEDLADAFGIAKMVWDEVRLRRGELLMSELHAKEIRVFNRITKTYPVSLLDRDWICSGETK